MTYAFTIEPPEYYALDNEHELIAKCQEWGLISAKATKLKTFYYKGNGQHLPCTILGFVDHMTAVIELDNGQKHCIHPSYLKEMQASGYSTRGLSGAGTEPGTEQEAASPSAETAERISDAADAADQADAPARSYDMEDDDDTAESSSILKGDPDGLVEEYIGPQNSTVPDAEAKPRTKAAPKAKAVKIDLPDGKVKMSAVVKEFTTVPNHFSDNDDEVIIYEAVTITEPEVIEVGDAWSSHSATMKKQELEVGDVLTFEAKIIKKKLTRNPVPYKINNPSKIQKEE
ncbi:hypothetical protein HUB98_18315 [Paenibacillus barcinonensis]|uniref:Uncharacterized protein n=1 Tax=Paenibacillus barcinonensis TaxID=198119 RepID=A0A2V4W9R9_PAEBA|nr:hypothetical protein [Paenibacillus barcinonensis]PYE44384.1 hypothetical protein DFQ00_12323 [Paenibacillus barcinonensis]QKS58046.1 hypothetical protein HUB98_18315 [Paenibacillus barcinonensis]